MPGSAEISIAARPGSRSRESAVYAAAVPSRTCCLVLALLAACGPGWTRNVDIEPPVIRREGGPPVTRTTRSVENSSSAQCSASASCDAGRTVRCAGTSRCRGDDGRGVVCEQAAGPPVKSCCDGTQSCEVVGPRPL